jgi:hypothetical protein
MIDIGIKKPVTTLMMVFALIMFSMERKEQ